MPHSERLMEVKSIMKISLSGTRLNMEKKNAVKTLPNERHSMNLESSIRSF